MTQQEPRKYRSWILGLVALVVCVGIFFWVREAFHTVVAVRTARVDYQDILSTVSTNGKVEPVEDFQAHAPMAGQVAKVLVSVGETVREGQELVKMDDSDARKNVAMAQATLKSSQSAFNNLKQGGSQEELLAARSDMAAAQAQLQQAQTTEATLEKLQTQGSASANEVATARQHVAEAQGRIATLKARSTGRYSSTDLSTQQAQIAQSQAALSAAQSGYAGVDIRSPLAGTVYSVPVSDYDFVQAGEALLNVADLNRIQVRAYFDEPEIGNLSNGQPVKIVWDAKPNRAWHGHIAQAPTTIITYGTRNVGECLITVDDAQGDLLPNTNVTVKVTTLQRNHVLSIPREALHTDGVNNFVYKIIGNHLHKTAVQVGIVTITRVEIVSGIAEKDTVALGATTEAELSDGLEVQPQP